MKSTLVNSSLLRREADKLRRLGESSEELEKQLTRSLKGAPDSIVRLVSSGAPADVEALRSRLLEYSNHLLEMKEIIDGAGRGTAGRLDSLWKKISNAVGGLSGILAGLLYKKPPDRPTALGPADTAKQSVMGFFKKYHQYQGDSCRCADFSISMACNIYFDATGGPVSRCEVDQITREIESAGGKFPWPDGVTAPWGIEAELVRLGIPFAFDPFSSISDLERALRARKINIVSEGQLMLPAERSWGHVIVIVGDAGDSFLVLDPAEQQVTGATPLSKSDFVKNWWYAPFHPCWTIG